MDFRKLLVKYIALIEQMEGTTYIAEAPFVARNPGGSRKFSVEEVAALKACEREAVPQLVT